MKYVFLLILLTGCGFKPMSNCVWVEKETLLKSAKDCVNRPQLGIKKEF